MQQTKNKLSFISDTTILIYLSVIYVIVHLIFINQYNYFRDELYYIACGNHLAFGYVDQPPFVALIAFIITRLFGESLLAIRILSVLAGGLTVLITGKITKQIGGSIFAQILSALMVMFTPVYLFLFHILSMNSFDILFWTVSLFILAKIVTTENSKYWLWFGLSVGIGFENKISILFLLFGLAFGLILTPNRKYLKDKYFWLGSIIALLISIPYLIWEVINGFPTFEFMRNASIFKNAPISFLDFLKEQVIEVNAVTFLLILCGLFYVFFIKDAKLYRIFGWIYIAIFTFMVSTKSKVYYLAPALPIVFSFGALSLERFLINRKIKWTKYAVLILLLITGAVSVPVALPVLPVENLVNYLVTIGIVPSAGENSREGVLPQYFADMFGWENMAEQVAIVFHSLSPEEQQRCGIYGRNYGEAGAIDFYGKKFGLPNAISGHNSYWHWGYDSTRTEIMIVIGGRKEDHEKTYSSVQQMGIITNQYAMPYENNLPIYVCRGLKLNFKDVMQKVKLYI